MPAGVRRLGAKLPAATSEQPTVTRTLLQNCDGQEAVLQPLAEHGCVAGACNAITAADKEVSTCAPALLPDHLRHAQELGELPPCVGTVVVRLRVAAGGAVEGLEWLTDTLVPLPAAEYSTDDARADVFAAIRGRLSAAAFPACQGGARSAVRPGLAVLCRVDAGGWHAGTLKDAGWWLLAASQ